MKLIRGLIGQFLDMEEVLKINLKREFALQCHIAAYMHSLTYLKIEDPELEEKKKLFRAYIKSKGLTKQKLYDKLMYYYKKEEAVIIKALDKIEEERKDSKDLGLGMLYKPLTWGVLTYEYEAID